MWIRSQDRTSLQQPKRLYIKRNNKYFWIVDYVDCTSELSGYHVLGTYDSQERAIEILDEIQKHLASHDLNVYEMPLK